MRGQEHKERHQALHVMLDELVADFMRHTQESPSKATIMQLMEWSFGQTKNPSENDPL